MDDQETKVPPLVDDPEVPSSTPSPTVRGAGGCEFPLTFNVYSKNREVKRITFQLGEHKDQPRYTVTWQYSWSGKTSLTLHTADADVKHSTPIASAESTSLLAMSSTLKLPGGVTEKLQSHTKLTSVCFSFVIPVPPRGGGAKYPEKFEWRQSQGNEVRSAASSKYTTGFKLVRLSNDNVTGPGGKRKDREVGETSDGKEVVAVWADYAKMSMSKVACFQFCGSGATGELGEDWTLMAVLSVLRLWQVNVGGG